MPEARVDAPIRERLALAVCRRYELSDVWLDAYWRDVATLLRLVEQLSERLYETSTQLSLVSERKECRGV
jgi:hypothetical protein